MTIVGLLHFNTFFLFARIFKLVYLYLSSQIEIINLRLPLIFYGTDETPFCRELSFHLKE